MCGICGKLNFDHHRPADPARISGMCGTIRHRGPDDEGIYVEGPVGLGMRRLSIIDLSTGHQPIANEDGTVWIVFNGEIYNFQSLREDLLKRGHRFTTQTDTEVIVHLYEEFGVDCLPKLRGMFGFAIWDSRTRTLLIARDRLGKKPMFYYHGSHTLTFGSELKALLPDEDVPTDVNWSALDSYLSFGYVPAPETIYKDVRKLMPGHYLLCRDGEVSVQPYWQLHFREDEQWTEAELLERMDATLQEAVRLRLISDVPLGAFLSGGIDSSAVVAYMSEQMTAPVKTFAIGFEDASFSELEHARKVAEHLKTDHHEFVVRPDVADVLPDIIRHFDEPFADASAIPTYYVCKIAREHVTVALSGDAGDEVFGGYLTYPATQVLERYRRVPKLLRQGFEWAARSLVPETTRYDSLGRRLRRLSETAQKSPEEAHASLMSLWGEELKSTLKYRHSQPTARDFFFGAFAQANGISFLNTLLYVDAVTYLPNDILVKTDRMSMKVSLELRCPLMDQEVVELMARVPAHFKVRGTQTKYLLKRLMESRLPSDIIHRPKHGFGVPVGSWLRNELRDMLRDLMLSPAAHSRQLFDGSAIERILLDHETERRDCTNELWALVCLELWLRGVERR
jgi:asparagine synthase (glutamine-hydrolysing)